MASASGEDLHCPICCDIFEDPVLLFCSHSFCKACWQRWWTQNPNHMCPVCKRRSSLHDPPQNLALKNLCEAFLLRRAEGSPAESAALCGLHSEKLKLFCLDHQEPVCVVCLHSKSHANHSFAPIDEAAADVKTELREKLKFLKENLKVLNDIKVDFDQKEEEMEVQAQDTEKKIKDVFFKLHEFLRKEEQERVAAVREEKQQKSRMMSEKIKALSREIAALSNTISSTEELLRAENISFLQSYKSAAHRVQLFLPYIPDQTPGDLMDVDKHLRNLPFTVSAQMSQMVDSTFDIEMMTSSQLHAFHHGRRGRLWSKRSTVEVPKSETRAHHGPHYNSPPLAPPPQHAPPSACTYGIYYNRLFSSLRPLVLPDQPKPASSSARTEVVDHIYHDD